MLSENKGTELQNHMEDYVVFDLETTGTSWRYDAVVEISGIQVIDGEPRLEFSTLVNPGRSIPYEASMVNGITDDMVAQSPCFEVALGDFLSFAGDLPLVGHNIRTFDMRFLYRDAERFWNKFPDNCFMDTLPYARRILPKLGHHRLVDLAAYYGISTVGAHRALQDCYMNQKVFECLALDEARLAVPSGPVCPACGVPMVKRLGRYGNFWGCANYPRCTQTKRI